MASVMTKQFKTAIINKLKNIDIPNWAKYVAIDKDGEVWGFKLKPEIISKKSIWNITELHDPSDTVYLFKTDFDSTNWKKTLINRYEWEKAKEEVFTSKDFKDIFEKDKDDFKSTQNSTSSTDFYKSIIKNNQSYLSLKLWFPGETTLVGRIIQAINIPHNGETLQVGCCDEFITDNGGLKVMNNSNQSSKDMVAMFPSREFRGIYASLLVDNLKKAFNVDKPRYIKATTEDFGKNVYIQQPFNTKGKLIDMTSKGEYIVEVDGKLYITPKAWKNVMASGGYTLKKTDGDTLEITLNM